MKRMLCFVFVSALSISLAACGDKPASSSGVSAAKAQPAVEQPAPKPENEKTYTIATDATYPPFEFEKDGQYVGIDIDLINEIGKEEGFKVDLKPMNFKGIIPALAANQLNGAIAGMSITDERKQVVDFSDPYFQAGLSMIVRKDDDSIQKPEDVKGKIIAIKKGTIGAKKAEDLAKQYGAKVNYYDDSPTMYQEVMNKNADLTIEDYPVAKYMLATENSSKLKVVGDRLNGDSYGIAIAKGNGELLKQINDGLKKLKESGKYDEIVNKYLGKDGQ